MQCLNGAFIFLIFNFAALFGSGQFKRTSRIDEVERGWDEIVAQLSTSQISSFAVFGITLPVPRQFR